MTPIDDCEQKGQGCLDGACVACTSAADCAGAGLPFCESEGAAPVATTCVAGICTRAPYTGASGCVIDSTTLDVEDQTTILGEPLTPCVTYCVRVAGTFSVPARAAWSTACAGTPELNPSLWSPDEIAATGVASNPVGSDAAHHFAFAGNLSPCGTPPEDHGALVYRLDGALPKAFDGWQRRTGRSAPRKTTRTRSKCAAPAGRSPSA